MILNRMFNIKGGNAITGLTEYTHANGGTIDIVHSVTWQWDQSTRGYGHESYSGLKQGRGSKIREENEERGGESKYGGKE